MGPLQALHAILFGRPVLHKQWAHRGFVIAEMRRQVGGGAAVYADWMKGVDSTLPKLRAEVDEVTTNFSVVADVVAAHPALVVKTAGVLGHVALLQSLRGSTRTPEGFRVLCGFGSKGSLWVRQWLFS